MGRLKDISVAEFNELAGKFRGQIDFYYWKGLPCVRKWPRKFRGHHSPAQTASSAAFGDIASRKPNLPADVKLGFKKMAAGSTFTWSDLFTSHRMGVWDDTGLTPPEVQEYMNEIRGNNPDIKIKLDRPGHLYLSPILGKTYREWKKEYRGTWIKCRRPIPKTLNKGYRIPIKITGKGPWKVASWGGYGRSITKYYTRDTAQNIYNKLVADLPAESWSDTGKETSRISSVLYSAPGPGLPYYGGSLSVARTAHMLPLDIPACWAPEDVNGITLDVAVTILHPPEYYKHSFDTTGHGDFLRWKAAIRRNITVPFMPGVAGSHLFSITPGWYSSFPPPGANTSEPNPYAYAGSCKVLRYRFTKGPWNTYEWSFKYPISFHLMVGISVDDEKVVDYFPVVGEPGLQAMDPGEVDNVKEEFQEEVEYQEEREASDFEMQYTPWAHDY